MKKLKLGIALLLMSFLALNTPIAESLEPSPNLPDRVVVDYSTAKDAKDIMILFGDGMFLNIKRNRPTDVPSIRLMAGGFSVNPGDEPTEAAGIAIKPGASNALTLEFDYSR